MTDRITRPQVGFLAACTEFIGAVALGDRVTDTIKNGIITIDRFDGRPGVLMLVMGCAEVGSATWLMTATRMGWPVSTTQTVVGALLGVGFASQSEIKWSWQKGSVSQVAASWAIAPAIAACFAALIFSTLKFGVLERKESFKWAMRLIPLYLAMTCAILSLFMVVEAPTAPSLEEFGIGKIVGIILGVFFGVLAVAYIFFIPYFKARLVREDSRIKPWHIPLGPLLLRENPPLYFPGKANENFVTNYYADPYADVDTASSDDGLKEEKKNSDESDPTATSTSVKTPNDPSTLEKGGMTNRKSLHRNVGPPGPRERFIEPNSHLPLIHPQRLFGYLKFIVLQGVTRDCVTHDSIALRAIHAKANKYDVRVEHLWTYCQVASAMLMSIAHGSNDVANAVGPWAASYETFKSGEVGTESDTPVWFLVVAGFLLGLGFWVYGFHIIRSLGNKITQMSPTRGFSIELGAAITVLLASRLALPVSTTQCLVGASLGVALMNFDTGAVNWKQLGFILMGWVSLSCSDELVEKVANGETDLDVALCGFDFGVVVCYGS